jgi:hypothetical protein
MLYDFLWLWSHDKFLCHLDPLIPNFLVLTDMANFAFDSYSRVM